MIYTLRAVRADHADRRPRIGDRTLGRTLLAAAAGAIGWRRHSQGDR